MSSCGLVELREFSEVFGMDGLTGAETGWEGVGADTGDEVGFYWIWEVFWETTGFSFYWTYSGFFSTGVTYNGAVSGLDNCFFGYSTFFFYFWAKA